MNDSIQNDIDHHGKFSIKSSSKSQDRSRLTIDSVRVVEITPDRVVEIVPARLLDTVPTLVVEIVPVLVVEIVPVLVVEMVPPLGRAVADTVRTNMPDSTICFTFFIVCSCNLKHQGNFGRLEGSLCRSHLRPTLTNI